MRRDYFSLDIRPDEGVPTLQVDFEGSAQNLSERLQGTSGRLDARDVDVAYRLLPTEDGAAFGSDGTEGVLSVTNRVTGAFILELNADSADIATFLQAAHDAADGDSQYRLVVGSDEEELATYEKDTFLVYDAEGNLVRDHSLIPSGVEI